MGNIVAKFDIDKLFAGVYESVDIITATVVDAMQMACLDRKSTRLNSSHAT